jgi:SET and MYND domain-containing protein
MKSGSEENFYLKWTPESGYGAVAPQDLPAGSVVMREEPYAFALRVDLDGSCHNCFKKCKVSKCSQCKFTSYCGENCQKAHWKKHGHKFECKILQENEKILEAYTHQGDCAFMLRFYWRAYAMSVLPEAKDNDLPFTLKIDEYSHPIENQITSINDSPLPRQRTHTFGDIMRLSHRKMELSSMSTHSIETMLSILAEFDETQKEPNIYEDGTLYEEIQRFNEFNSINGVTIYNDDLSSGMGIYPRSAFFNHSCLPNCSRSYVPETHTIEIKTIRPVKQGEELFLTYTLLNAPYIYRQVIMNIILLIV